MSVGKNSIKRAAGKTAAPKAAPAPKTEEKDEVKGAAPELANSCSTPASKTAKKVPAKKTPAKKAPAKKPVEKTSENLRPETAAAVEAVVSAPVAEKTGKVQVTEELPYYLL